MRRPPTPSRVSDRPPPEIAMNDAVLLLVLMPDVSAGVRIVPVRLVEDGAGSSETRTPLLMSLARSAFGHARGPRGGECHSATGVGVPNTTADFVLAGAGRSVSVVSVSGNYLGQRPVLMTTRPVTASVTPETMWTSC